MLEKPDPVKRFRRCPDCGEALVRRNSIQVHPLLVKTYVMCRNVWCGATFKGVDELTHRMSPPRTPNPEIDLPYCVPAQSAEQAEATETQAPAPGAQSGE